MPRPEPIAPLFRPRRARTVAYTLGAVVFVGCVVAGIVLVEPGASGSLADMLYFMLFGVAVLWFCHREGSVVASPSADGLTVRNLLVTRRLAWAEILGVRFPKGDPWVKLDLADGDTLAVMAIQQADGDRALHEAARLRALVHERGEAPQDD